MGNLLKTAHSARAVLSTQEALLHKPVRDMETDEAFMVWSVLDGIEKTLARRKKQLRQRLLDDTEHGEVQDSGSCRVEMLGGSFTKQRRWSLKVNARSVRKLLIANGVGLELGGTMRFVPDDDKLLDLVADGQITQEELAGCYDEKVTHALVVQKPEMVRQALEGGLDGGTAGNSSAEHEQGGRSVGV